MQHFAREFGHWFKFLASMREGYALEDGLPGGLVETELFKNLGGPSATNRNKFMHGGVRFININLVRQG